MLTASDLLKPDETLAGSYQMEIGRWSGGRWTPTVPVLWVMVTDQRVIIQAQHRKYREPAIIPAKAIAFIETVDTAYRPAVLLRLKGGPQICLLTSRHDRHGFVKRVRHLITPPSPVEFTPELQVGSLHKLIDFLEGM